MPTAFSYIRFSSKKQELGASKQRQEELRDRYLLKHPELTLSTENYEDLGVSAYRGKNAAEGNLKMFLDAVKSGNVPNGSFLLIESIDRLSRAEVTDALQLFLSITNAGITIVTLLDERAYSKGSIQRNWTDLIITIAMMARSTEESATKGSRVADAWKRKREAAQAGQLITRMAPAWLTMSDDRKSWIVDSHHAALIGRMFDLAAAGHGCPTIARTLNEEGSLTASGRAWTFGAVHMVLTHRAVIGEYVSRQKSVEPLVGYFPVIVDPSKFAIVQETMRKRRWIGGRSSESVQNLFAGMSYCGVCTHRMRVVQSTAKTNDGKLRTYLRCTLADDSGGCGQGRFPYLPAEKLILQYLAEKLSSLIARVETEEHDPLAIAQAERLELTKRMGHLLDLAETGAAVNDRVTKLQAKIDELDEAVLMNPAASRQAMRDAAALFEQLAGDDVITDRELRLKLQVAVRKIVSEVTFVIDEGVPHVVLTLVERFGRKAFTLTVKKKGTRR